MPRPPSDRDVHMELLCKLGRDEEERAEICRRIGIDPPDEQEIAKAQDRIARRTDRAVTYRQEADPLRPARGIFWWTIVCLAIWMSAIVYYLNN